MIKIENLKKSFRDKEIFENISFVLNKEKNRVYRKKWQWQNHSFKNYCWRN